MGISIWQLVIVLVIVMLLFGTKKLRNIGADLGGAVKGFKGAMKDGAKAEQESDPQHLEQAEASGGEQTGAEAKEPVAKERDSA